MQCNEISCCEIIFWPCVDIYNVYNKDIKDKYTECIHICKSIVKFCVVNIWKLLHIFPIYTCMYVDVDHSTEGANWQTCQGNWFQWIESEYIKLLSWWYMECWGLGCKELMRLVWWSGGSVGNSMSTIVLLLRDHSNKDHLAWETTLTWSQVLAPPCYGSSL